MSNFVYLTLLPPLLIGFLFTSWLIIPTKKANLLLVFSLSAPIGFGITSCLFFLWSYFFNPGNNWFLLIELGLIATLAYFIWKQKRFNLQFFAGFLKDRYIFHWVLGIIALSIAIIAFYTFINYTKINPHGRYDAWAIWNVRARMLARDVVEWKSVFLPQVFHADYPLLIPLTIALSWIQAGTESMRIPPTIAGFFTFASAGILSGTLFSLKRWNLGWLASIVFLSTPWVIYFGSLQFSDLPLAAYILSASSCFFLALSDEHNPSPWLILAGLSAGFAGWTKNEGQLFLIVFVIVASVFLVMKFKNLSLQNKLIRLGIGLLLPIFVILLFKIDLAPANDVVNTGDLSPALAALIAPGRYLDVLNALMVYPKGFGGWLLPIPAILLSTSVLLLPQFNFKSFSVILPLVLLLLLQWVGYFLIFVITPHQLQVHINQSYDRLLMHLYPTFLLLVFSFLRPFEAFQNPFKKPI
jgi:hypothetical protein